MQVTAIMASDSHPDGRRFLLPGDRAAISWGVSLAGKNCRAFSPAEDDLAQVFSRSLGADWAPWDNHTQPGRDLILLGPGAIQLFGDELAGHLAELHGAELLFDVIALQQQQDIWKVTCDAGRGARDMVRVRGPLVVVVSEHAPRPAYVSRFRLSQVTCAKVTECQQRSANHVWQSVTPRTRRTFDNGESNAEQRASAAFGIESRSSRNSDRQIVDEEPAVSAQVLLRYLVHHGFISRSLSPADSNSTVEHCRDRPSSVEPAMGVNALTAEEVSPAVARGPRQSADTSARIARRPRDSRARSTHTARAIPAGLQRAPRRVESKSGSTLRGPFPMVQDHPSNTLCNRIPLSDHTHRG